MFELHPMVWTRESAARFWDHQSKKDTDNYFSLLEGEAILDFVQKHGVPLTGNVLDYGCGPGFLMEKLMKRGLACEGVDYSPTSIEETKKRVGSNPLFRGVQVVTTIPSPVADNHASVVFFIETIEHILDADMDEVLNELYRITAPGGYVVVTTPHTEDLEAGMLQCPECGCRYHYMQHVQTWTAPTLARLMESHGFQTHVSQPTLFRMKQSRLNWLRDIYANIIKEFKPHLVYIGKKPQ